METTRAKSKMKSIFEFLLRTHAGVSKSFSNMLPAKPIPFTPEEREKQLAETIAEASEVLNNIVVQLSETNLGIHQIDALRQVVYALTLQQETSSMVEIFMMENVECPTAYNTSLEKQSKKLSIKQKKAAKREGIRKTDLATNSVNLAARTEPGEVETNYAKRAILKMKVEITEGLSVAIEKKSPHPNDFPIPTAIHPGILDEVKKLQQGEITQDNIGSNRYLFHQRNCPICELGIMKLHVQRNGTVHIRPRALMMICAAHIPWPTDVSTKEILGALFTASSNRMEIA